MRTPGIRLSFSGRTALKIIRLIPAVVIMVAMLQTVSCTNNNGLLPQANGGDGSDTPTATPTSGTGALAFVTNFNDGKVSSFTRNTTTGVLKRTGQVTAGKKGPRGVIAAPSGSFLYVANINDDNIYEFSVSQTNGTLTPLSPASVSNGNNSGPDELAMNSSGTLLWVTGAHNGTVAAYTVNTSTGQIKKSSSIGGFNTPFGIALHPTLAELYVSDTALGIIQPMSFNTTTGALAKNLPAVTSSDPLAVVPAAIAIDSGGDALFTPDQGNGEVSSFSINTSTGALTPVGAFTNISATAVPVGIGIGSTTIAEYVFTANSGDTSVSSFVVSSLTTLIMPPTAASGYNAPKGLVVDPQNAFVYTADSGDGTVGQATINGTCGTLCAGPTVSTESPANANSGPFGITLAQ
jgi:6-phosphogluconolactonase